MRFSSSSRPADRAALALSVLAGLGLSSSVLATPLISTSFVSDANVDLAVNGTQVGLVDNAPQGNWVVACGYTYAMPIVKAAWWGSDLNAITYGSRNMAMGLSLQSAGAYTKPTEFTISGDLKIAGSTPAGALGFWSTMPNGGQVSVTGDDTPLANFTGLRLDIAGGTLQVYENGILAGTPVAVGSLSTNQYYNLSYAVDTATGDISSVVFDGAAPIDFTTTAFTNAATAFAGVLSEQQGNGVLQSFSVTAVPEPTAFATIALGVGALTLRRRRA